MPEHAEALNTTTDGNIIPVHSDESVASDQSADATPPRNPVLIFCDGACIGNPGPGGHAAIIRNDATELILWGCHPASTNNRQELQAAIAGLVALRRSCPVIVYSDSKLLVDGMTTFVTKWQANGWKAADKKPVKNKDLWLELIALCDFHQAAFQHVRGHSGHTENEECDRLAEKAARLQNSGKKRRKLTFEIADNRAGPQIYSESH